MPDDFEPKALLAVQDDHPMHIHKPKPLHGVREILTEIGVIVVGILIAITAEQAVEALAWRDKLQESEQAMRAELVSDDGRQAYMRAAISPCLDRQLDDIARAVSAREGRAKISRLAHAYSPPPYTWDDQAWQAAVAAGIGPHMGARRTADWANVYSLTPVLNHLTELEFASVDTLRALPPGDGALDEEGARRALSATASLQRLNAHLFGWSETFLKNLAYLHVSISVHAKTAILARARQKFGGCVVIPNPELFKHTDNLTSEDESRSMMYRGDSIVRP